MKTRIIMLVAALAALIMCPAAASAHRVNVFAYVEGGKLMGEGYFPGGKEAQTCKVVVSDADGKVIGQSETNADGSFQMPLPQGKPPYTVVLEAGMGHKASYQISAKELGNVPGGAAGDGGKAKEAAPAGEEPAPAKALAGKSGEMAAAASGGATLEEVRRAVGEEVDKRLRPLQAQVARLAAERGIKVSDVLGGLGYILGLVGLAAWFQSRRKG